MLRHFVKGGKYGFILVDFLQNFIDCSPLAADRRTNRDGWKGNFTDSNEINFIRRFQVISENLQKLCRFYVMVHIVLSITYFTLRQNYFRIFCISRLVFYEGLHHLSRFSF